MFSVPNNTALSFSLEGNSSLTSLFSSAVRESNDSEIAWCSNLSSDSSTAKQFKAFSKYVGVFAAVFPMSDQWSRIFSISCENLYVPSLTLCSKSIQQHQDTLSLQYKQERAAVRESASETCVWGNSVLQCFVLCLLLEMVLLLDTSKYSLHAKMYATYFIWLHHYTTC